MFKRTKITATRFVYQTEPFILCDLIHLLCVLPANMYELRICWKRIATCASFAEMAIASIEQYLLRRWNSCWMTLRNVQGDFLCLFGRLCYHYCSTAGTDYLEGYGSFLIKKELVRDAESLQFLKSILYEVMVFKVTGWQDSPKTHSFFFKECVKHSNGSAHGNSGPQDCNPCFPIIITDQLSQNSWKTRFWDL